MEHCKKLVLLPHETLARLQEKPAARTSGDVMSDLDTEMQRILTKKAEDSEKYKLYDQALQRYLFFVNEQKKPATIILPDINEPTPQTDTLDTVKENLMKITPKKFKSSAALLYEHLNSASAKNLISWDTNGLASFGGKEGKSIIDLISDAVRTRKHSKVKNWREFASILKSLHTPLEIIGNSDYLEAIQSQEGSGIIRHAPTETKQPPRKKQKTKQQEWTRWR